MRSRRSIEWVSRVGVVLAGLVAAPPAVLADNEPVIVVPGRAGVPVMMYGVDVSGAVIEGEWGLNRPGVVAPTVIMPYWPAPNDEGPAGAYFPTTGHKPPYGRLEIKPPANRRLPKPAQPYHREWHSHSDLGPATLPMPFAPPPIVVAPRIESPRPVTPSPPHAPPGTP